MSPKHVLDDMRGQAYEEIAELCQDVFKNSVNRLDSTGDNKVIVEILGKACNPFIKNKGHNSTFRRITPPLELLTLTIIFYELPQCTFNQ